VLELNSLKSESSTLLLKIRDLEEKLLEAQLERITDEKITQMLSIQKCPADKTGLGYVASTSKISSTSKTVLILPNVFHDLTILLFWIFAANLVGFLCRIMSAGSPQRRVRQRTVEYRATLQAKTMDRTVIAERDVIRSDIMVPPLDSIHAIIQMYNWGYLHSFACVMYTRLVKLFYANLEVVQNNDRGLVLQSTVVGHIITVDP